jgi:pimeloyl-ACP methyl ester carboxylesterase
VVDVREARVKGRRIRWRVAGEGPPLVLVHGLSGSWRWWGGVLPLLSRAYTCHLLDLPRFSGTVRPDTSAEWLAAWTDEVDLRQIRLVGHSLGGAAAARLAAMRAEVVEALVLVAAVGMPARRTLGGYAGPLLATLRTTNAVFLVRIAADALRAAPSGLLRGGLYAARADLRDEAGSIRAPTLLIWGERDALVPLALAAEWRRTIPSSSLVVLPGAGHIPMVEQPRTFAKLLHEFLDEPGNVVGCRPMSGVRRAGDDGEAPVR